jgi:hypothetical protein
VLMVSRPSHVLREPHDLTDGELAGRVYQLARCAGSRVDPDDWFPEERRAIRRPWLAGTSVTEFLQDQPARLRRDQQTVLPRSHPGRRRGSRPGRGRLV